MTLRPLNPMVAVGLLIGVATLGSLGWLWYDANERVHDARRQWYQKNQERDQLIAAVGSEQTRRDCSEGDRGVVAQARLAELRSLLSADEVAAGSERRSWEPIDGYLEIAKSRERLRELASNAQVAVRKDERFGFASHATEGPSAEFISSVMRQHRIAQLLLQELFSARPHEFLSLQRERPLAKSEGESTGHAGEAASASARSGDVSDDFFEFDANRSLRVPGRVHCDAFRVEFTGKTEVLRSFLNALMIAKLPFVVRAVEVKSAEAEFKDTATQDAREAIDVVPVITQSASRFVVTVECVELVREEADVEEVR